VADPLAAALDAIAAALARDKYPVAATKESGCVLMSQSSVPVSAA
jgi:hypothetical protein